MFDDQQMSLEDQDSNVSKDGRIRSNYASSAASTDEDQLHSASAIGEESMNHLAKEMFQKSAMYFQGELALMQEDYKLLENLNKAATSKYFDMRQLTKNVAQSLNELNEKYKSLEPFLQKIDQIETSVNALEQAVYKLDSFCKRLEAKFKFLEQHN